MPVESQDDRLLQYAAPAVLRPLDRQIAKNSGGRIASRNWESSAAGDKIMVNT